MPLSLSIDFQDFAKDYEAKWFRVEEPGRTTTLV